MKIMKLDKETKKRIDDFFDNVDPEKLIEEVKNEYGDIFYDIDDK